MEENSVENIVQAIARDLLSDAIKRLEKADFEIVMHEHDEVVIETKDASVEAEINAIMSEVPSWAKGLVMDADGYECEFYRKD